MARIGRLNVDESKIIKKDEKDQANPTQVDPIEPQVVEEVVEEPQAPIPTTDSYFAMQQEAEEAISSHKHDTMFAHNPTNETAEQHARVVYHIEKDKEKQVTVVRGALRQQHTTTTITYTDTIQELINSNQKEIYRTEVEIELHKRLINAGGSNILETRLNTFQENLSYLKSRQDLLNTMLAEEGELNGRRST